MLGRLHELLLALAEGRRRLKDSMLLRHAGDRRNHVHRVDMGVVVLILHQVLVPFELHIWVLKVEVR